jgi:hypothetical protein
VQECINRRIKVQAGSGIKQDPTSKIIKVKKAGGMAQVVENKPKMQGLEFNLQYCQKKNFF